MKINRKFFYDHVKRNLFRGTLKQSQVDGINHFFDYWDARPELNDLRWLAYILATTYHETDQTFKPIEEYGKGKNLAYGKPDPTTGKVYYGRGFVQLTWKSNYDVFTKILKKDLTNRPELALDLTIATEITFYGMTKGSFTGKKLSDYFNTKTEDWVNARRIINGTDKAVNIANYAKDFYASLNTVPVS
jgi:putative chitinase